MQAVHIQTNGNMISITVDRTHFDGAAFRQIQEYLRPMLRADNSAMTAAELRRLPRTERDAALAAQTAIALKDFEIIGDCPELDESAEE